MYTDVFTKGASSDACVPTGKLLGINDIVLITMLNLERLLVREISIIRKKYLSLPYPENDYDMHRKAQIFW